MKPFYKGSSSAEFLDFILCLHPNLQGIDAGGFTERIDIIIGGVFVCIWLESSTVIFNIGLW